MVSPRRSSRARSTAHPVTASHSASSHSSASSSRSRHTRRRSEDADLDASYQRGPEADLDEHNESAEIETMADDDGIDDSNSQEDEITRCICGYQEYQGGDDDQTDTDGLFIQCDECSVWQHGFCVGVTDSKATPENYYCERCKPELHKEGVNKAGMRTSIYLPTQAEQLKPISQKEANQKRRTTMNSRDAEYDDEVFKRMLELSKQDAKPNAESTRGSRGRKRGTSEGSDETSKESKRPRTSDSPETTSNPIVESGDEKNAKASAAAAPSSSKKSRNGGTRNSNTSSSVGGKRTSTRNRAVEKAEPRKDDSEHSDDYAPRKNIRSNRLNPEETVAIPPPIIEAIPDIPQPPPPPQQQPPKRTARSTHTNGNGRRRGNNRLTRQSEDPNDVASSMAMSRDQSSAGHGRHENAASVLEKPTKPRLPAARMTINEMKKRVNGISEYITRTQVEMASSRQSDIYAYLAWMEEKGTPVSATTPKSNNSDTTTPTSAVNGISSGDSNVPQIQINGNNGTSNVLEKASEALSGTANNGALDIMEILSTKINRWQQHYGEKI